MSTPNADSVPLNDHHHYVQRKKLVHSGQLRRYYAAGCGCGWRSKRFRVTDERAVSDWFEHVQNDGSVSRTDDA